MQIFVKISSASKVENLPFSEKSAELATLAILRKIAGILYDFFLLSLKILKFWINLVLRKG